VRCPGSVLAVIVVALGGCAQGSGGGGEPGDGSDIALGGSIPPFGQPGTLDVATWNLEWFGSTHEGPSDEGRQLAGVRALIAGLEVDLWAVEEVVSASQFDDLLAGLPYDGLLASDPSVEGNWYYTSGEQKVAIIYRPDQLEVIAARTVLRDQSWAFAGRPPLEVALRDVASGDTFYLVVLHAKAMAGLADWQRRRDGALALRDYLASERDGDDVLVIGDYNDDLDQSTRSSSPSPYAVLVDDYFFATYALAQANRPTTVHGRLPIDHALAAGGLADRYREGSAAVFPADDYIDDYGETTSDHLPVVMRFEPASASPPSLLINEILANEPGSDTAGEFVEIVNPAAEAVDAGGFTLSDSFAVRRVLPAGTTIAPGAALVVDGGGLGLDNAGETVTLADAAGGVIDRVVYGTELTARDGVSMTREVDGDRASPMLLHDLVSALPASPGLRSDGSPF